MISRIFIQCSIEFWISPHTSPNSMYSIIYPSIGLHESRTPEIIELVLLEDEAWFKHHLPILCDHLLKVRHKFFRELQEVARRSWIPPATLPWLFGKTNRGQNIPKVQRGTLCELHRLSSSTHPRDLVFATHNLGEINAEAKKHTQIKMKLNRYLKNILVICVFHRQNKFASEPTFRKSHRWCRMEQETWSSGPSGGCLFSIQFTFLISAWNQCNRTVF